MLIKGVSSEVDQIVGNFKLHHSVISDAPFRVTNETTRSGQNPPLRDQRGTTERIELWRVRERTSKGCLPWPVLSRAGPLSANNFLKRFVSDAWLTAISWVTSLSGLWIRGKEGWNIF